MSEHTFAVVGATGAVGREMVSVLEERELPISSLRLLASERSAGERLDFQGEELVVEELQPSSFDGVDVALFSAGGAVSAEYAPHAVEAGAVVIDNSSHFRMDLEVPLIVPEVNGEALREHLSELPPGRGTIIANPNCSTIQLVVVLKPILDTAGIKRVVVSTYQAVSGAGKIGMDELWQQSLAIFNQDELRIEKFAHQIAFNCVPHCDSFLENGYTKEEMKVVNESRKILQVPELRLTATAVRVPVFNGHGESVNVETERALSAAEAQALLRESPGVIVLDDPNESLYPLQTEAAGSDATFVGRIRQDDSLEHGLNLWIVADNLRKGAALNAVQIAEIACNCAKELH